MPNPFGITEVDVPGILNAYETGQTNRIRRIMYQQQAAAAERQAERDTGIREELARLAGGAGSATAKSGATTAYAQQPAPMAQLGTQMSQIGAGIGGYSPTPAAAPAPAAPPAARPSFREAIPRLLALGMEPAQVRALAQLDDDQSAAAVQHWQQIGPLYVEASRLPYEQRRAYINSVAPQLAQLGISQQEIQSFDPTDTNLSSHIALGTTMAQALDPRLREVGGELVSERALPQGTRENPVVYSSPYIPTPQGLAERPPREAPPQYRDGDRRTVNGVDYVRQGGVWRAEGPAPAGSPQQSAPAFSADVPLTLEDRRSQYPPSAPGRAGPQGPRTFR